MRGNFWAKLVMAHRGSGAPLLIELVMAHHHSHGAPLLVFKKYLKKLKKITSGAPWIVLTSNGALSPGAPLLVLKKIKKN